MRREILVVDDDRTMVESLDAILSEAGYAVRTASNAMAALESVRARRPDLVLLDVMMPGRDGLDLCRELRAADPQLPVVFLTALETSEDELRGLASGGDGYIGKSVPEAVMLARIAAILRMREEGDGAASGDFDFAGWRVEAAKLRMVRPRGRAVALTEREVAFLRLFASRPGVVFDRDAVITRLWGPEADVLDNALSTLVHVLRGKLGRAAAALVSVRGSGYAYRP